jgi:rhodanese-related sulfurtransferase
VFGATRATAALAAAACLVFALGAAPAVAQSEAARPGGVPIASIPRFTIQQGIDAFAKGEIVLVDVRMPGQRAQGHIKGDIGIPYEQLPSKQASLQGEKRLIFYCSCPAEELALGAASAFMEHGYNNVGVLVGGYDGWKAAGGPVQVDATWEQAFRVSSSPIGWGKTPIDTTRCTYSRDGKAAAGGKSSGCIVCRPDSASRGFAGFTQKLDAANLKGRRVVLSAMVRSENVLRIAFIIVGAESGDGRVVALSRGDGDPITGTHDWRTAELDVLVPDDAAKVIFGVTLVGAGTVWLDDVKLMATAEPGKPAVNVVVVNPSFEQ